MKQSQLNNWLPTAISNNHKLVNEKHIWIPFYLHIYSELALWMELD